MSRAAPAPSRAGLFFRHFLTATALAVVSGGVSAWSFARHFEGGISYEFCHYAEIGRNLLEGKGYRTFLVEPSTLAFLDARGIPYDAKTPAPVLDRFPLQAALSAAAEGVAGKTDSAIALLSMLSLALCAAATYYVGVLVGFSEPEAAAAGLLLGLGPSFQRGFVLWGLPDFGFCLLTLLATAAVARGAGDDGARGASLGVHASPEARRGRSPSGLDPALRWAAAGALSGAAWLARSNFILWLPLLAAAAWRFADDRSSRPRRLLWFSAGCAAASAPGWIYNLHWFGGLNPPTLAWNLAHHTVTDTEPWLRYRVFTVAEVLASHPSELRRKFVHILGRTLRDFPTLWQLEPAWPATAAGFWVLARSRSPRERAPRRWTLLTAAILIIHVLAFSCLRYESLGPRVQGRYLLWFAPAALLLAARGAASAGRIWKAERPALGLFTAVNALFFLHFLSQPQGARTYPNGLNARDWPEVRALAGSSDPGLVVANLPGQVAWYARRAVVALPAEPEDFLEISRRHDVSVLLLSRLDLGELAETPAWRPILHDPKALRAFCRAAGLELREDFGTSILLTRPRSARQ